MKKNYLYSPLFILFLSDRQTQSVRCIDFKKELENSLDLLNLGFLARYFSTLVATTTSLLVYIYLIKAPKKPKKILAIFMLPITYYIAFNLIDYLATNIFSYCF